MREPDGAQEDYDQLTYDELTHQLRRQRGFAGKELGAVLETRVFRGGRGGSQAGLAPWMAPWMRREIRQIFGEHAVALMIFTWSLFQRRKE